MNKPLVQVRIETEDDEDPLAPARGVANGLLIGALMWSLVITGLRMAGVL